MTGAGPLRLSHYEIRTADAGRLEDFYSAVLGFVVTDRGGGLVFLSADPEEHHQIVLHHDAAAPEEGRLDHIALRLADLGSLRRMHAALTAAGTEDVAAVSHGTSWSVYFRDPDGNRLEIFVDTPWHVDQPVRFPIDLSLDDAALTRATERAIRDRPGFGRRRAWFEELRRRFGGAGPAASPRAVVEAWVEAFNRSDAGVLAAMYDENAVNHQVPQSPVEGRAAIRAMFEREFANANMTCIVENIFEDGDWAVLEWRDPLGLRGCGFFRVAGGRIAFQRGYWDKQSFIDLHGRSSE